MREISKAALGRRLKVSRARITQLLRLGLPVLTNGKVDEEAAVNWYERHIVPSPKRMLGKATPSPENQAVPVAVAAMLQEIREIQGGLANFAIEIGCTPRQAFMLARYIDLAAVTASSDMFSSIADAQIKVDVIDWKKWGKTFGHKLDLPTWEREMKEILDRGSNQNQAR